MSVSYFVGARSGQAKKSGNWFGCFMLLHKNQFGQWSVDPYWFEDKNTYDILLDGLAVGSPVCMQLNTEMKVTDCSVLPEVAPLPLSPD